MRIVIIGGTGHIGTYLVPKLVASGHDVIVVSRGSREPYRQHPTWRKVKMVELDRPSIEKEGNFGLEIANLQPDAVMDLICFELESAVQLVEALRGKVQFFAQCGTIWVRSYSTEVPAIESHPRNPISEYGWKKNAIEIYLLEEARVKGFPACVLHPGHIVGPGWIPVGPTACHDPEAVERLIRGEEVVLPNLGMETLHHVHADDVAQAFMVAFENRYHSVGESFFVVSPAAMTLRGFAEGLAARFGVEANLHYEPFEIWQGTLPEKFRQGGIDHVNHCSNASIEKAKRLLDYRPRYSSLDAVEESVLWLLERGKITR